MSWPKYTWVGVDGSTWLFGADGVRLAERPQGIDGWPGRPEYGATPGLPGATYRSTLVEPRRMSLTVWVGSNATGDEWRRLHSRWRDSLGDGTNTGTVLVVAPGTGLADGHRSIAARLDTEVDPRHYAATAADLGQLSEVVRLVADDPAFRGVPILREWTPAMYGAASIPNPGDLPGFLRWELRGPFPDGVRVGVGGRSVALPPIAAGVTVEIDGHPDAQDVRRQDTGADLWPLLPFDADVVQPIPPHTVAAAVSINATGNTTGSLIRAQMVGRYTRAAL